MTEVKVLSFCFVLLLRLIVWIRFKGRLRADRGRELNSLSRYRLTVTLALALVRWLYLNLVPLRFIVRHYDCRFLIAIQMGKILC